MAENEGEKKEGEEGAASGGMMVGNRGWIIVITVIVLQAIFTYFFLIYKDAKNDDLTGESGPQIIPLDDYSAREISLKDLNFTIQDNTGNSKTLSTNMTIVLEKTPDEVSQNVTLEITDWDKLKTAVDKMEPRIRDTLTDYITQQSASQINSPRGKKRLKEFLQTFINDQLETIDLDLSSKDIKKRKVTKILITNWVMM